MSDAFWMMPGCEAMLRANGLATLESVFAWEDGERLDKAGLESWRQRWRVRLTGPRAAERTFYLKRFDRPPARRQFQRWRAGQWTLSTAGIEWANARYLAAAGVAAVEPVAFGQEMAGIWERRSFILLREMTGESLERWLPAHLPPPAEETDWPRRRAGLDRLARIIGALHAGGFVHRDLYLSHVFIQSGAAAAEGAGPGGDDAFALIDLQRVFRPRWRRRRWAVKDLAALNYSTPADGVGRWERLRFLCRYAQVCRGFGTARQLAPQVAAKTAGIARHQARRHRPPEPGAES